MRWLTTAATGVVAYLACGPAFATPSAVELMLSAPGMTSLTLNGTTALPPNFNGSYAGYTLSVGTVGNTSLLSYAIQVSGQPVTPLALTVALTETGLTPSAGSFTDFTSFNTAIFHTSTAVTFATYFDVTDTAFGETALASSGSVTGSNETFANGPFARQEAISGPYSLTKVITFTPSANGFPTLDGSIEISAPEPMSLALLATGVGLLGLGRRVTHRRVTNRRNAAA